MSNIHRRLMAILAIGFTNTYLAVNAQGTCVANCANSGQQLDAHDAGYCTSCSLAASATDYTCWCQCSYFIQEVFSCGTNCDAGTDVKGQLQSLCANAEVCISYTSDNQVIIGTDAQLNACQQSAATTVDSSCTTNQCLCTWYTALTNCWNTYCPSSSIATGNAQEQAQYCAAAQQDAAASSSVAAAAASSSAAAAAAASSSAAAAAASSSAAVAAAASASSAAAAAAAATSSSIAAAASSSSSQRAASASSASAASASSASKSAAAAASSDSAHPATIMTLPTSASATTTLATSITTAPSASFTATDPTDIESYMSSVLPSSLMAAISIQSSYGCFVNSPYSYYSTPTWYQSFPTQVQSYYSSVNQGSTSGCTLSPSQVAALAPSDKEHEPSSPLSTGQKVGAAIGSILGAGLIGLSIHLCIKHPGKVCPKGSSAPHSAAPPMSSIPPHTIPPTHHPPTAPTAPGAPGHGVPPTHSIPPTHSPPTHIPNQSLPTINSPSWPPMVPPPPVMPPTVAPAGAAPLVHAPTHPTPNPNTGLHSPNLHPPNPGLSSPGAHPPNTGLGSPGAHLPPNTGLGSPPAHLPPNTGLGSPIPPPGHGPAEFIPVAGAVYRRRDKDEAQVRTQPISTAATANAGHAPSSPVSSNAPWIGYSNDSQWAQPPADYFHEIPGEESLPLHNQYSHQIRPGISPAGYGVRNGSSNSIPRRPVGSPGSPGGQRGQGYRSPSAMSYNSGGYNYSWETRGNPVNESGSNTIYESGNQERFESGGGNIYESGGGSIYESGGGTYRRQ